MKRGAQEEAALRAGVGWRLLNLNLCRVRCVPGAPSRDPASASPSRGHLDCHQAPQHRSEATFYLNKLGGASPGRGLPFPVSSLSPGVGRGFKEIFLILRQRVHLPTHIYKSAEVGARRYTPEAPLAFGVVSRPSRRCLMNPRKPYEAGRGERSSGAGPGQLGEFRELQRQRRIS